MKKTLIIMTSILLSLAVFNVESMAMKDFDLSITDMKVETIEGMYLTEVAADMVFDNFKSKQEFQILEPNNSPENNVHLVVVHAYKEFGWGMKNLEAMLMEYQSENPHLEVLGGINGDFYLISSTGQAISTVISEYEAIKGISSGRNVVSFRTDGSADIGVLKHDGYEVLLISEDGIIKAREKVSKVNGLTTEGKTAVLFDKFAGELPENAILIEAEDIKINANSQYEFAKGAQSNKTGVENIKSEEFAVVSDVISSKIEKNDKVLFQAYIPNSKDIRGTVGGRDFLVKDGEIPTLDCGFWCTGQKAPRTSVGIRENGEIFFLTTNGRDESKGVDGPKVVELARIMKHYGAVNALNLDGGGSTTMMVRDGDKFRTVNTPSDGNLRSLSTAVIVVRGDVKEQPIEILGEDNRVPHSKPLSPRVDHNEIFRFEPVLGATRYIVNIDGVEYETSQTEFDLSKLLPGEYKIKVKVKGNLEGKQSDYSDEVSYRVKKTASKELLEYIRNLIKNNI